MQADVARRVRMRFVYALDQISDLLPDDPSAVVGGKAAGLAAMAGGLGMPVPPGFVISTSACLTYLSAGWPPGLDEELSRQLRRVEQHVGRRFGGPADPLLVSVRSGAPVSMPGMMDTILNLGLNDDTVRGLAEATGDADFAGRCRARFEAMFRNIAGTSTVPRDPRVQLRAAIEAVFRSWNSNRALAYRAHEGIPDHLGTAVTVQAMVFGNRGPDSGTGVLFTRDPSTGDPTLFGDVMFDAQGEDVVSGRHRTQTLATLVQRMPEAAGQVRRYATVLERHYGDLCEIEFTIERGHVWMLQVRVGKRSPRAALRIAVDMAEDPAFPLTREQAVRRVAAFLANPPAIRKGLPGDLAAIARGLPASPGLATGQIVVSPTEADAAAATGPIILVRGETSPEDVPAMSRAAGVLTSRGGLASHAAVVARGWGIPAVVGAASVALRDAGVIIGGQFLPAGARLTIDGSTGEIFAGEIPGQQVIAAEVTTLQRWAEDLGLDLTSASAPAGRDQDETTDGAVVGDDELVHSLSIKMIAAPEVLATALLSTTVRVQQAIARLATEGLIKVAAGSVRLTETGMHRADALMQADRAAWGEENTQAALDQFLGLDLQVKSAITAWQLREAAGQPVINDHTDARYDTAVLVRLQALQAEAAQWLGSLARLPRLGAYAARLDRALRAAQAGDQRFVSSPRVDSYHGAWFELHEYLIRLAGRTREAETAAGRA